MPAQFTPLTIDSEQWRLDIKTFAEATNHALEAIISQLSNGCSPDGSHQELSPHREQASGATMSSAVTASAGNDTSSDFRFTELKSQLAQRLSKST